MNLQLTPNERQIMDLIWASDRPLSRQDILAGTKGRTWNPSSIHLILNSMLSKGFIRVANEEVKYGRTYEAAISWDEYMVNYVNAAIPDDTSHNRLYRVVSALVNQDSVDAETIDNLEKLLEEKKNQLKGEN